MYNTQMTCGGRGGGGADVGGGERERAVLSTEMNQITANPIKWPVHPAKSESDTSLLCLYEEASGSWLPIEHPA